MPARICTITGGEARLAIPRVVFVLDLDKQCGREDYAKLQKEIAIDPQACSDNFGQKSSAAYAEACLSAFFILDNKMIVGANSPPAAFSRSQGCVFSLV